jgi:hypothetical protein
MENFKKIIEQLRHEKYFLYDVVYTEFDSNEISIDDGVILETNRERNVPKDLLKLLSNHLSNGLKLRPVKAGISFKSYRIKVPEQRHSKIDSRCDYPIEVDFEKRRAIPHKCMRESPDVRKIYEDFERIFIGYGWQFSSEK